MRRTLKSSGALAALRMACMAASADCRTTHSLHAQMLYLAWFDRLSMPLLCFILPAQSLELAGTHMPSSALPALSGLRHLEDLMVDLTHCQHLTTEELEGALCVLCKEVSRALQLVEVRTNSVLMDTGACRHAVAEQVEAWGRHTLSIRIR